MEKRKIIIDCDTGTDDAIAIVAALYSPEIEVEAITTVTGNVSVQYTSENTLDLVDYLGFDTPVSIGAWGPLKLHTDMCYAEETHGKAGLGDVVLPKNTRKFTDETAVEMIYKKAVEAKGELEVIAIGPLTNIAITMLLHPEVKKLIKHLWIMGGSVYSGNITPTAEFNMWCDPEAARMVFKSGIPCTLVGLDVTEKAILSKEDITVIRELKTKAGNFVADVLDFMDRRYAEGGEDLVMHDALAVAAALCPECLQYKDFFVDVECEGTYTYGHTLVDIWEELKQEPNVQVAVEVDFSRFQKWLHGVLKNSQFM